MNTAPAPTPALKSPQHELLERIADSSEINTALLSDILHTLSSLVDSLAAVQAGIATAQVLQQQPAQQVATPAGQLPGGQFVDFMAAVIVYSIDEKGNPAYKIRGADAYQMHGVRVWPEVLPALGVDASKLRPGPNQLDRPFLVRALLSVGDDGANHPKKIIGLGGSAPVAAGQPIPPPAPPAEDVPF